MHKCNISAYRSKPCEPFPADIVTHLPVGQPLSECRADSAQRSSHCTSNSINRPASNAASLHAKQKNGTWKNTYMYVHPGHILF